MLSHSEDFQDCTCDYPLFLDISRMDVNKNLYPTLGLRSNATPPLFDVLPFEINIENYFSLIGIICTLFDNFPRSSVG